MQLRHVKSFAVTDMAPIAAFCEQAQAGESSRQGARAVCTTSTSVRSPEEQIEYETRSEALSLEQSYYDICLNLNLLLKVWSSARSP
jgi:hypothetical protein